MSRWERYVLRPRVRGETSGSETVPHIGPYHYHVCHALLKLSHGHVFDFEDCFLRYMAQAAELVHQLKTYAPWLQAICNYGRNEDFVAKHHPKLFCPPVRDTMNVLRRPNDPFATYVVVRQHVNERNMQKAFQKEVYHFEVN